MRKADAVGIMPITPRQTQLLRSLHVPEAQIPTTYGRAKVMIETLLADQPNSEAMTA
jgi:hypothetical protein